jgi:hypothetical protein
MGASERLRRRFDVIHSPLLLRVLTVGRPDDTRSNDARNGEEMGNRANFVIVENQDWQLYYSHWGGCRFLDALIGAPELALRYAAALRRCTKIEWCNPCRPELRRLPVVCVGVRRSGAAVVEGR